MWGTHAREFFSLSAYSAQSTEDHTDTQSTHLTSSASSSLNQHRARNPRAHTRQTTAVAHKQQIHKTNQHVCGTRGAGGLDLRARCCMSVVRWRSRITVRGTVALRWPVGVAVAGRRSRVLEQLEVAVGVAVHDEVGLKQHRHGCSCSVLPSNAGLP